ncbi:MAG: aspartate/tyrosine/aromatic aminotransferase [Opitutales bacterium]|nr:aspartate/tyrosine/aromatic aminotransferase [Opitutales bacterium]
MHLFDQVSPAPADPILGLSDTFRADPRPEKVNLTVGVYQDEAGKVPALRSVTEAELRLTKSGRNRSYLPISGLPAFNEQVQALAFGEGSLLPGTGRIASLQTPGGTGALRVAAEFIAQVLNKRSIWVSKPTWANHPAIFARAGFEIHDYPYFDAKNHGLDREAFINALKAIPEGDVVLLHGCCHNPTGVDPSAADWEQIAGICRERKLVPIVDFAYQGFDRGLAEDTVAVQAFAATDLEFLVASSFSKNFGLYQERTGALHVVADKSQAAGRVLSQLQVLVRTMYSNPPAYGAHIVATILNSTELRAQWESEVAGMRNRIRSMRELFVQHLKNAGVSKDFGFLLEQNGMFSFSGLKPAEVEQLREEHAVYMIGNGRINVAGITSDNVERLCQAIAKVLS